MRAARNTTLTASLVLVLNLLARTASPDSALGEFVRVGDMSTPRWGHTATLLSDGRVLIAGGGTAPAEIYDPAARTFKATRPMHSQRQHHSATLLADGRVLLAGGRGLSSAEVFDPKTETFVAVGDMLEDQFGHSAALLPDGRVLIVGGMRAAPPWPTAARAELYDPRNGTFSFAGAYAAGRGLYDAGGPVWPSVNVLADGKVLIVGDHSSQIYEPSTDSFELAGRLTSRRYSYGMFWHTATSLPDGSVLVTGGNDDWACAGLAAAEIFDPSMGTFRQTAGVPSARDLHTATLLSNGLVLIAGGGSGGCGVSSLNTAELYDPASESFLREGAMTARRAGQTATLLQDGTVLLVGGFAYWPYETLKSVEIYVPAPAQQRRRAARR